MGGKGFGVELWGITSFQPRSYRYGGGNVMVLGGIIMTRRTALHVCRGMSLDSTTETMALSLLLCPAPVGMGMHSPFKTTMQEPIVHVLSKITCSFTQSRLSHGQRSPHTCLQLNICGTSLGDVSRNGLTSQRTARGLLMHSRRQIPSQPFGGLSGA